MPLGPYKDWTECTAAQKRKGYSSDVADKICGKIEANAKAGHKKKKGKKK